MEIPQNENHRIDHPARYTDDQHEKNDHREEQRYQPEDQYREQGDTVSERDYPRQAPMDESEYRAIQLQQERMRYQEQNLGRRSASPQVENHHVNMYNQVNWNKISVKTSLSLILWL